MTQNTQHSFSHTDEKKKLPPLVAHCRWCRWWRLKCPECPATFWNGRWQHSALGYPLHFAVTHLGIVPFRLPE